MKIRALIVDDEPLARSLIRELLSAESWIDIVTECGNGNDAVSAVRRERPDLLFLDVQMPGMSGVDVVASLEGESMPYVIFVTAYDHYAIEAFRQEALDYLLKPFSRERFQQSLRRARRSLRSRELASLGEKMSALVQSFAEREVEERPPAYTTRLQVRTGRKLQILAVSDVAYFEAANQYVRAHTREGPQLLSRSLSSLEKELDPRSFCRIHRSTLVNTAFVRDVFLDKGGACSVVLTGGERLRLSRRRRGALEDLLRRR